MGKIVCALQSGIVHILFELLLPKKHKTVTQCKDLHNLMQCNKIIKKLVANLFIHVIEFPLSKLKAELVASKHDISLHLL
jgi:hypothetical protein